jgi:hypothetical protein
MQGPTAIGRLDPDGPWVGFVRVGDAYRLAAGHEERVRITAADGDVLLALAIAYFEDVLDEPPPSLEATHGDMSDLVRSLVEPERDPEMRRLLAEAVDSIDDGLAVDEVLARLVAARRRVAKEQADPLDLLRDRVEALSAGP